MKITVFSKITTFIIVLALLKNFIFICENPLGWWSAISWQDNRSTWKQIANQMYGKTWRSFQMVQREDKIFYSIENAVKHWIPLLWLETDGTLTFLIYMNSLLYSMIHNCFMYFELGHYRQIHPNSARKVVWFFSNIHQFYYPWI